MHIVYSILTFLGIFGLLVVAYTTDQETESRNEYACFQLSREYEATEKEEGQAYRLFTTKTPYLTAREEIQKRFNVTWPLDEQQQQCSPIYLFFLNRHSIRYPSLKEMGKFRQYLPTVKATLLAGGKLHPTLFKELYNWQLLMQDAQENHVSQSGRWQSSVTAQIFYKYFPSLFDIDNVQFEVGITPKIRTTETADAFIRSLIELQTNVSKQMKVEEMMQNKFPFVEKDILMSHKYCKKLMANYTFPSKNSEDSELAKSKAMAKLLNAFSVRNGLPYTISLESLIILYRVCSYEWAIQGYSPWCLLFTGADLQVIDYMLDISEYSDSYNVGPHRRLACTVMGDLYTKLQSMTIQSNETQELKTTLYFSHENLLSKLISYLDLFNSFPQYKESDDHLCIPKHRQWQSSLLVPFGTNFAAVLYRCEKDSQQYQHRLLTLLNEIPVKIRGCDSELCDLEDFFKEYSSTLTDCDLDAICKVH